MVNDIFLMLLLLLMSISDINFEQNIFADLHFTYYLMQSKQTGGRQMVSWEFPHALH